MIGINYICYGNHSGYSQAAQDLLLALHQSGKYDIRIEFILHRSFPNAGMSKDRCDLFKELSSKPRSNKHIQVYHCTPATQHRVKTSSQRTIGCATFETFQPPNSGYMDWIKILNKNSAIMCPSRFNYKIFAHEGIDKPLFYIPHCYDTGAFHPRVTPIEKRDKFTFLFFGSWRMRKGYPQLIEAWCREFSADDDVQLLIKTDKVQTARASVRQTMNKMGFSKKETAPILFEESIFDERQLPQFFKSVDCLVSPTLGEGFGLPGLQCMALGVPVIITDFSGCQDYANEDTSTLLEPTGFVMHQCLDNLPQFKNKKWAFVPVKTIQKKMRYVWKNQDEVKDKARVGHAFVRENFNYEKAETLFSEMVDSVFDV